MSNEEALKGFANYCKECRTNAQTLGADVVCGKCKVFVAKQAIEKQIPKEPSFFICGTGCYYCCPDCEEKIYSSNITFWHNGEYAKVSCENKYCRNCGKRLRWTND